MVAGAVRAVRELVPRRRRGVGPAAPDGDPLRQVAAVPVDVFVVYAGRGGAVVLREVAVRVVAERVRLAADGRARQPIRLRRVVAVRRHVDIRPDGAGLRLQVAVRVVGLGQCPGRCGAVVQLRRRRREPAQRVVSELLQLGVVPADVARPAREQAVAAPRVGAVLDLRAAARRPTCPKKRDHLTDGSPNRTNGSDRNHQDSVKPTNLSATHSVFGLFPRSPICSVSSHQRYSKTSRVDFL